MVTFLYVHANAPLIMEDNVGCQGDKNRRCDIHPEIQRGVNKVVVHVRHRHFHLETWFNEFAQNIVNCNTMPLTNYALNWWDTMFAEKFGFNIGRYALINDLPFS